jgi:hypothetical protein
LAIVSISVLFYNEPNFEASFADKLLMLFAGDPLSDQAKYKSVAQIARTPLIVTRNTSPFRNETKWNDNISLQVETM